MLFFSYEQYKAYIYVAAIAVFLFYVYSSIRKRSWLKGFGRLGMLETFSKIPRTLRNVCKGGAVSCALCCLGLVLLIPKWQTTEEYYETEGLELVFVIDVSLSMLAEDVKPNRLQRAKIEIENLLRELENDYVGLVVFAGRAYAMLPYLTTDYDKIFLRILHMVNENYARFIPYGTNVGNALLVAISSFSKVEEREKILIFLTDGEERLAVRSQVGEAVRMLMERKDISVYLIGVGDTHEFSSIPKKDKYGRTVDYELDMDGEIIKTRPDPTLLKEIAKLTGGQYIHDESGEELKEIFLGLVERHKKIIGVKKRNVVKDVSQHFLGGALLFLVLFLLL
ncbi:MAG: VWA domain-containing protein [Candidatus Scalindua sp. AMX11]|nr:MAG: VWA domain-containing protein [Candidatus Scalindua sp.]NOG85975.1 VWA domain-containing protein [Planctomycetota bacterium]RZV91394.1 MAG: VWA domain-containing protein [Candidatus Scalindua sp. SCAELEC01]TDE65950.1 MAG: VWA domain-containing protein [Candidatus Scalindua sp. AMX11]GJQ59258.1 MAG: membrane protein [Candidatus Scalindua sp.]